MRVALVFTNANGTAAPCTCELPVVRGPHQPLPFIAALGGEFEEVDDEVARDAHTVGLVLQECVSSRSRMRFLNPQ